MKSILIHNFTKRKLHLVERFLRKHKLYNVHAIIPGEDFTEEIKPLLIKYGLNVMIPVYCTETGHESVVEIEKRNPGFEQRVLDYPRHKIELLRYSAENPSSASIAALAVSFPRLPIRCLRSTSIYDAYYVEHQTFNENVLPQLTDEERDIANVVWSNDLSETFQLIDFGLLQELGMVGEEECLLLTKA